MNPIFQALAVVAGGGFAVALGRAAWRGQDAAGRWLPGSRRLCAAAGGWWLLLLLALHWCGVDDLGLHYNAGAPLAGER
ncbi:MAG: hypothetical protein IT204_18815 [Fimbriimonadaceae bacterium]|nr:hypothetical protein [Fimbriimonadaceae bacterium]